MGREYEPQLCDDGSFYLLNCQYENLKTTKEHLKSINIAELSKGNPVEISKACGAIFLSVGNLHTVLGQVDGTWESY